MVTELAILDVLRTIDDPEMPINIVDLGIVDAVRVDRDEDTSDAAKGRGTSAKIAIEILPTFVGCPALPVIENEIRERVHRLAGVGEVDVHFKFDPPWTVDRHQSGGAGRATEVRDYSSATRACGRQRGSDALMPVLRLARGKAGEFLRPNPLSDDLSLRKMP